MKPNTKNNLADFIVIGAGKAGTTSLYSQLMACPSVFMTSLKEPEFFARDDCYEYGLQDYAAHFSSAREGQRRGEASTVYSITKFFPETPARIREMIPSVRLIYMLRNPVDRAYSMYQEIIKHYQNDSLDFQVNRTFEEFIYPNRYPSRAPREKVIASFDSHYVDDPDFILNGSDYLAQIRAYREFFAPEQMMFILFEDYKKSQEEHLARVLKFIGADSSDAKIAFGQERRNTSDDFFAEARERDAINSLKNRFFDTRVVTQFLPKVARKMLRRGFLQLATVTGRIAHGPQPMLHSTRLDLQAHYEASFDDIERMTGLSLDSWRISFRSTEKLTD